MAVYALQNLASRHGRYPPGSMSVRQFLALVVGFGAVVVKVEKISGMGMKCANSHRVPWRLSATGQTAPAFRRYF